MKKLIAVIGIILFLIGMILLEQGTSEQFAEKPRKGGILMVGSAADSSWNEAHRAGIDQAAEKLELPLEYEENVTPENCPAVIERMIANGCNIIISTSISFEEGVKEVAQLHHDVSFLQATGNVARPNLAPYMGRMYQARYLAGIVAGKYSRSHAIGYIATVSIPEVIRGIDAFALGARHADPDAVVHVKYTGSWSDDEQAKIATEELLSQVPEIDVISMHLDTYGPLQIARAHGIQAIGCNVRNPEYEDILLTATIWNWDTLYSRYLREAIQGRLSGRSYLVGMETGIVDLAPLSGRCDEEIVRMVQAEKDEIVKGEKDVFYGPIYDQQGNLRAAEGENLSDKVLFDQLDWYVEGVRLP